MKSARVVARSQQARAWMADRITRMRLPADRSNLLTDPKRIASKAYIGKMYFFAYDAKHKDTLPIWDKFPLVFPMEYYDDGFLGMNLHYLDPYNRLLLLDRLMDFVNNDKYDDTTTLRLSYSLLAHSKRYKLFEPCIKRYLFEYMRSPMIYVEPDQWENAIFLPVAKFVYND
jgi:hypothetical protein